MRQGSLELAFPYRLSQCSWNIRIRGEASEQRGRRGHNPLASTFSSSMPLLSLRVPLAHLKTQGAAGLETVITKFDGADASKAHIGVAPAWGGGLTSSMASSAREDTGSRL